MTKSVNRRRIGVGIGAGVCAWALVLSAGCDQRSDEAKAVETATRDLHGLTGASPEPAMEGTRQKTFTKIAGDLGTAAANGSDAEKSAAALLVSQTQLGLGEVTLSDAAGFERDALNQMTEANAVLSKWRMSSAVAGAAESYDPSAQRADIAKSRQEKEVAIQQQQAHKSEVQGQFNDLSAKAKAKMDAAAAKEAEYGRLTQQAVKLTAVQAAPVVQQANKFKREGDALRLDGSRLEAQAQAVAPLIVEIDAVVSQLTNQKKNLEGTDASLAQQLAASKAEAAEARSDATAASVELEKQVAALTHLRSDSVDAAYTKALGLYTKGANAARDAAAQSPGAGKAAQGDAQMCLADVHWQRSQGLKAYAGLLNSLATAEPALPKRGEYAGLAKAAQDQAKQEMEAAGTALEAAKTAFSAVRVTGAAKDKLNGLTTLLEAAIQTSKEDAQGTAVDFAAMAAGKAAPAAAAAAAAANGSPAPEAVPGAAADPALKAAAEAMVTATKEKRWPDLAAMFNIPDESRAGMATMLQMSEKQERLDAAFKAKFGKGLLESAASNPMLAQALAQKGFDPAAVSKLSPADLVTTSSGDQGSAAAAGTTLQFKKVDGKWLYSDSMVEMMGPQMATMAPMMAPLGKAMDDFAGEVEAGKYPDANTALQAFQAKMMQAMGAGGPPGGPKKGPGGG